MGRNKFILLLTLTTLCVLPAHPAIVTYSDLASWQANAVQSGATIDFSTLAPNPGNASAMVLAISSYPGIIFSSPGDYVQVFNASAGQFWYQWNSGAILRAYNDTGSGSLKVDLSTPVTAFAALMGINNENPPGTWIGSQMAISVRSGATVLSMPDPSYATAAHPALTFIGVVSTTPGETFDSITFAAGVNYAFLDDIRLGAFQQPPPPPAGGDVPEPGTAILALCGVGLLAGARLRTRLTKRQL